MSTGFSSLIASQRAFFRTGATRPYAFRKAQLEKLYKAIQSNEQAILDAVKKDLNKSQFEGTFAEVALVLHEISFMIKHLHSWMKPTSVTNPLTHFGSRSKIYREPYGVNLIIAPWNYPFQLALLPLVGAIAGGNTATVKPSELSVQSSLVLAELIGRTFPEEYIACVQGGVEESTALLNEKFDHIFFTGSVKVGSIVMREASKNLTPVTLELGGKSPTIVDASANLKLAARRIAWGKFLNAGQTCIAPDYVYVHHSIEKPFLQQLKQEIISLYTENPLSNDDYTHIINDKHTLRLQQLLKGTTVYHGGKVDTLTGAIEPTVLTNVSMNDPVMQDEIFGPILPVISYDLLNEVILQINNGPKPLALYLFSEDEAVKKRVIEEIPFGGGCVNDTLYHVASPYLPFGGVGHSGLGSYHGKFSFDAFTHAKGVLTQTTKFDLPVRYHTTNGALGIIRRLFK